MDIFTFNNELSVLGYGEGWELDFVMESLVVKHHLYLLSPATLPHLLLFISHFIMLKISSLPLVGIMVN